MTFFRIESGLAILLALAFALTPARVRAAEKNEDEDEEENGSAPSIGAEVDASARFVWRGIALSRGSVAQPSIWASAKGLTASAWTNVLLNDEEGSAPRLARARSAPRARTWVTAIVPAITYTYAWRALRVEPGAFVYVNPSETAASNTAEASLEVACVLGAVSFVSSTKVDVASYAGAYFGTVGAAYERSSRRLTIKTFLDLGWATEKFNEAYLHTSKAGLNVVEAGVSARYELSDTFYVMPHTELSGLLVPSAWTFRDRVLINGGAALGVEF